MRTRSQSRKNSTQSSETSRLPKEVLRDVVGWLPNISLVVICAVSPGFRSASLAVSESRGYLPSSDGLRTEYLLESVLGVHRDVVNRILAHLIAGEGQWIIWGDDAELTILPTLADFWGPEPGFLCLSGRTECLLDSDDAIAACPSSELRSQDGRFSHECYKDSVEAALTARDGLPATKCAHGNICVRCGTEDEVLFTADIPTANGNLCSSCLDETFLTRYRFLLKHSQACFFTGSDVKGPYTIPARFMGTKGTREGIFFAGGAQHTAFGLEFWASPPLVGVGGLWPSLEEAGNEVPPNAWEIVSEVCDFGGP